MGLDGFVAGKSGLLQAGLLRNLVGKRGFFFYGLFSTSRFCRKNSINVEKNDF